jgi:hypothetical protein
MNRVSQKEFLNRAEHQLEAQLKEVLSVFQNLPENVLMRPAENNGWSILECIEHLNTYAAFYQPQIARTIEKASGVDVSATFKHSFLGGYFIKSMDPDRSKKKYKALKIHKPVNIGNPNTVVPTFIQHLENMLIMLKQASNKNLGKNSIVTSISSWIKINPGDALQFLLTHNKRHLEQAKRNL